MLGLRRLQGKGGAAAAEAGSAGTVASTHGADIVTAESAVRVAVVSRSSPPPLVHKNPAVIEEAFEGLRRCVFLR